MYSSAQNRGKKWFVLLSEDNPFDSWLNLKSSSFSQVFNLVSATQKNTPSNFLLLYLDRAAALKMQGMILHCTSSVMEGYFDSSFIRTRLLTRPTCSIFSLFCSVFQMLSSTLAVWPFPDRKAQQKEENKCKISYWMIQFTWKSIWNNESSLPLAKFCAHCLNCVLRNCSPVCLERKMKTFQKNLVSCLEGTECKKNPTQNTTGIYNTYVQRTNLQVIPLKILHQFQCPLLLCYAVSCFPGPCHTCLDGDKFWIIFWKLYWILRFPFDFQKQLSCHIKLVKINVLNQVLLNTQFLPDSLIDVPKFKWS